MTSPELFLTSPELHIVLFQLLLRTPGTPSDDNTVKSDTEPLMECQDVMQLSRILQDNSEPQKAHQQHGKLEQFATQNLIRAIYVRSVQ